MRPTPLVVVAIVLGAAVGHADEPRGTVLRIDGDDLYVDLGSDAGVAPGSELVLYHVVSATHPVTKKKVRDTFELGRLSVAEVGRKICVAHAPAELRPRVAVGDEIGLFGAPQATVDPWAASAEAQGPIDAAGGGAGAAQDPAARKKAAQRVAAQAAAEEAWRQTLGQPPEARIAVWRAYLKAFPDSPLDVNVRVEIASLAAQARAEELGASQVGQEGAAVAAQARALERLVDLSDRIVARGPLVFLPPARVYEGSPVELTFHVTRPGEVKAAWVSYRSPGEPTYHRAELVLEGDGNLRQKIPGDAVRPPRLEYFVVVKSPRGEEPVEAYGTPEAPATLAVDASVEEPPPDTAGRSRITMTVDYVDFDGRFQKGFDQYVQAEVDFMYRFRRPVWAVRVGYGTLGGIGGPKEVIDASPDQCMDAAGQVPCRHVNYTYTYVEVEHRFTPIVAVMVRPIAGAAYRNVTSAGEREYFNAIGFKGRLRFGKETDTNLVVGLGLNQSFGTLFEAAFNFDVVPRVPIVLSAQVTDQPVVENFGVRLIADVGLRRWDWVYPSVRVAYQARSRDHAGYSGGLGLNFDW